MLKTPKAYLENQNFPNLYMDYVMRVFLNRCKQKGVSFLRLNYLIPSSASNQERARAGNHEIDWIGYADDVTTLVPNLLDALQSILHICEEFGREFNVLWSFRCCFRGSNRLYVFL